MARTATFVSQTDCHLGNLTVNETLTMAHACLSGQGNMERHNLAAEILNAKGCGNLCATLPDRVAWWRNRVTGVNLRFLAARGARTCASQACHTSVSSDQHCAP